ncbi:hypothetical protein BC941DRAFT_413695 [Chlamydoabsidia padenii]|nr:hypothetical protein BC941DRAFT_413695 [Chlamydoabsidia padenii]
MTESEASSLPSPPVSKITWLSRPPPFPPPIQLADLERFVIDSSHAAPQIPSDNTDGFTFKDNDFLVVAPDHDLSPSLLLFPPL